MPGSPAGQGQGRPEIGQDLARPGDHRSKAFPLIAEQRDVRNPEQTSDLGGDGGEDVSRGNGFGHQRRDAAERRLLRGNLLSSVRAAAFAIAMATSSVNAPIRVSVSAGSGSGREEPTAMIPQSRPPARTGTPTAARTPMARTFSATGPLALL